MATPKIAADGDAVDEAHITKAIQAGDGTLNTKIWGGRIRYTGTAWEVFPTSFSTGVTSGAIAFSVDHINITLTGFTQAPVVIATPTLGATRFRPEGIGSSNVQAQIQFKNAADTVQTTQTTDMDCQVMIWGN